MPPVGSTHSLGGRVVAAGAATRREVAGLLGLDSAGDAYEVTAVAWMDHALELSVRVDDGAPIVFRIERRTPQSKGLVVTQSLNVYSRGRRMPAGLAEVVRVAAPVHLSGWTTDRLGALVERDPEVGRPGLPMPAPPDEEARPQSLLDTWGAADSFADFFAGGEMARCQLDSIDPSKVFHFVQHCDDECLFVNPHSVGRVTTLVSFPWDDRVREPSRPFEQALGNLADREFIKEGMVTTSLDEDDVIRGNPEKLRALLDYATSREASDDKMLFVSNTCVPVVIGEDVKSQVDRFRRETGKEILYLTVTPRSMVSVFSAILVERRLRAEAAAGEPDADAINLIGFSGNRPRAELERLIGGLGLHVNARLLPELTGELVDALPEAPLSVYYPNALWQHLYDQLVEGSRTAHITPQAPYGFEGTRRWIESVAEAVQRTDRVEALWAEHVAPWMQRWRGLREQAAQHRLGFVVRDAEAFYLTDPAATWGVPLLALAEEMGFAVDVLIHASARRQTRRAARAIHGCLRDPSRHSILAFKDQVMLRQRLDESPSQAFLSYHFFDWRLTQAGKASFSIQHFEMGVPGAVRTLERLLRICRTSFYRKYRKHLRRSAAGLRLAAGDAGGGPPDGG